MRLGSRRLAALAIFAALYAVLRLIPVSPLIGVRSSFTMGEVFSPIVGMILGPLVGGFSIFVGTFLNAALGRPLVFDGLDFMPGVFAAVTAGLAISGRVSWSIVISIALIASFSLDPLSPKTVTVGQLTLPFLWMHGLAVLTMLLVAWRIGKNERAASNPAFIIAVVFMSTMNAHVSGGIMFENVLVRLNGSLNAASLSGIWKAIFFVYPLERAFFLVVGSVLAIPILRRMPRNTLDLLRGKT